MAAPALVRTHVDGVPLPTAFAAAPMIRFNRKDSLQHRFVRSLTRREIDPPTHFVPAVDALRR